MLIEIKIRQGKVRSGGALSAFIQKIPLGPPCKGESHQLNSKHILLI